MQHVYGDLEESTLPLLRLGKMLLSEIFGISKPGGLSYAIRWIKIKL